LVSWKVSVTTTQNYTYTPRCRSKPCALVSSKLQLNSNISDTIPACVDILYALLDICLDKFIDRKLL